MVVLMLIVLFVGGGILAVGRYLARRRLRHTDRCLRRIGLYVASPSGGALADVRAGLSVVAFAEAVAFAGELLTGEAQERLREIVRYHSLDSRLVRLCERSQGSRRAYLLALLARLPLDKAVMRNIEPMLHDEDCDASFYALMCCFAIDEHAAIQQLASFDRRLSHFEVAELLPKVCRCVHSVAWTPLLRSTDYNLCLLGINVVHRFAIIESEADLQHVVTNGVAGVQYEALCALSELQCNVALPGIRHWLQQQRAEVREAVCRQLVRSGYSALSVAPILGKGERRLFEQMLHTYKRHIG